MIDHTLGFTPLVSRLASLTLLSTYGLSLVGNSILLAAFQEVGMVDAVFAGKLHAADTHGVFPGDGDLGFHDTEK